MFLMIIIKKIIPNNSCIKNYILVSFNISFSIILLFTINNYITYEI